ncbi:MAG: endonuclease/exonuclease/phosphatase family protein [Acholeplasmataceae bacterium]
MKRYRMLSFNVRIDLEADGDNRWLNRRTRVIDFLNGQKYEIIGFQEVTPKTYEEIKEGLPGYGYVGTFRYYLDEATPIFYRKDRLNLIESDTFWLSDTPSEISKYENSFFYRIATYAVFGTRSDRLIYVNTHLDYHSDDLSFKQLTALLKEVESIRARYSDARVVIGGDFNQVPGTRTIDLALAGYQPTNDRTGPTYHGFGTCQPGLTLDYFFITGIEKYRFRIIKEKGFLSDHHPIELTIKK